MPGPLMAGPGGCRLVVATGHALSLALVRDGEILAEDHRALARGHAEALVPALAGLLAGQPHPEGIVVETGPGSFTGLRIGIAAARALGLGWDVPVAGVSSMLLVAAAASARGHRGRLAVALAAPRGQLWVQRFDGLEPLTAAQALEPAEARTALAADLAIVTGSGLVLLGLSPREDVPRAADARYLGARHFGPPAPDYVGSTAPVAA